MKSLLRLLAFALAAACCTGIASAWQSDNSDGTYTNPVLYADYADPDIIRVGGDFYMVSTTFVNSPGINLLKSQDLVNWELVAQVASTVDGGNSYNMVGGTAYEKGYWASSIRHHGGTFYVAVQPTFANGRIYHATHPAGPWSFHQLDRNIYDPGLFIDTNGTGYIVCGHGPQNLMTLNATFSQIVSQQDDFLDSGAEGSHMVKRGSYYYVFNAKPSVWPFELRCSRTTSLSNPVWETRVALTAITGGHQGAIVDIDNNGNWFGFVHQDSGAIGRMPRIGPVFWENDWPIFGTPANRDVMPATGTKPVQGMPLKQPATSDDFSAATLGLQWAWNHNPDNTRWSLTQRPGHLRLRPTQASGFWAARNTLTQKAQGPRGQGVVRLDLTNLQPGDIAGFGTLGKINGHIAVNTAAGSVRTLSMHVIKDKIGSYTAATGVPVTGNTLYLRTDLDFVRNLGICSYSADGANWTPLGGNFPLMFGYGSTFQGEQFAMFCYNPSTASSAGYVDVDSFTFTTLDDNADLVKTRRGRPTLNAARTTFVGDNGQPLRGPYESTEWTTAAPLSEVAKVKDLGSNAVHLYAEVFNPNYPASTSNTPGYAAAEVDKFVQMTRDLGLYLVMTIGNGANNGNHNFQWAVDFWNFYAPRYKDETHVVFEIHNEPMAWGPSYLTGTTPAGALDMEVAAYNAIRAHAPDTPVLLMTYAVFGGTGGTNAALTDIREFNQRVFGNPNAVWTNEAVGFHGYAGWEDTATAVSALIAAGYPCMMTEFIAGEWGGEEAFDAELATELERLGVSWLNFLTIPPAGVSPFVTDDARFKNVVEKSGLSWVPDYGTWPVARGPYGNGGVPRRTPAGNTGTGTITGTLRIQAEDFDTGGEGVAYHDADATNQGGVYRTAEGVDLQTTADAGGGHSVGSTAAGEWLEYSVLTMESGYHDIRLRYASPGAGGDVRIHCNGQDRTGGWALPSTGSATTWSTATRQVFLERGQRKLRLEIATGGFALNWIEISPATSGPVPNGTYKLANRNSGQAMTRASDKVVQSPFTGGNTQLWNLQHVGAGQYRVTSVSNNSNWNSSYGEGSSLDLVGWWGIGGRQQRVVIRPAADGFHRLSMASTGNDLGVDGQSFQADAVIEQFKIDPSSPNLQWAIQAASAPGFPAALSAVYLQPTLVGLKWSAVSGATGYSVKRSNTSGGPYTPINPGVSSTSFNDATAVAGTTYYYVVSAQHPAGSGLDSGEAVAVPVRAHLRFDETSGTTAADSSGGWDGTLVNGPTWIAGNLANSVNLDGSNDHVTLPNGVVDGLASCTIACWVYVDTLTNWSRVFDFGTGTNNYMFLTPRNGTGGGVRFAIRTPAVGEETISGGPALVAGTWNHVAVTLSGRTGVLFVNGIETGRNPSMTLTPSSLGNTTQNRLGRSQFSNDPYLDGRIDDFRIYSGALTASVIASLADLSQPPPAAPAGLVATGGNAAVALFWSAPPGAISYTVKRSSTSGSGYSILSSGVAGTGFEDTAVMAGATYFYTVSATGYGSEGPDSGEVSATTFPSGLRLPFDEGSGTIAGDTSGNGWNGTLVNDPTWAAGKTGTSVRLDGTDDHATLPDGVVSGLGDFTLAAWVKLDTLGTWSRVFDFGTGTDNYMFLTPRVGTTGNIRFAIRTPSQPEQIINGTAPLPTGVWTHVAVTRAGTLGTLYVNGAAVGSGTINLSPADLGRTTQNYLGRSQWAGDTYLDGQLDDFRIHASALSATDLAAIVSGPPVITSPTVASGGVGNPFVYQIAASNSPTGYAATGLPGGLVVNETTGLITGTPAASGNFNVGLSAGNFAGSGDATLALTIDSPPISAEELRAPEIELAGGNASLTVATSVIGHSYQLQYNDDLSSGQWLNHGAAQAGTGGVLSLTMPFNPSIPRRFFRVLVQR